MARLFSLTFLFIITISIGLQAQDVISLAGQSTTLNGSPITANTSLTLNDEIRVASVATHHGQILDLVLTVNHIGDGTSYDPSNGKFELVPYNSSTDSYFEIEIEFVESGTNTVFTLTDFEFLVRDIDSDAGFDIAEVIGYSGASNVSYGANLEVGGFINGGGPSSGVDLYRLRDDLLGSTTDWSDEVNASDTDTDHFITASFSSFSGTRFVFGATGSYGSSSFARGIFLDGLSFYEDYDRDGVADINDLDDDNDGILDVSECVTDAGRGVSWYAPAPQDPNPNIGNNSVIASASPITFGTGLTSETVSAANWFQLTDINATNITESISNNEYAQYDILTENWSNDVQYYIDEWGVWFGGASSTRPKNVYSFQVYVSDDNFSTNTMLSTETRYVADEGLQRNNVINRYLLSPNTNYSFRVYFYDLDGGATTSISHDDFTVYLEKHCDTDQDGIPNYLDLDSDNDGIPDIIEAGGVDSDGDGLVDVATDTDGDGLVDTYDNDDADGPDVAACNIGLDCDLSASTSSLLDTNADGTNDFDGDMDGDNVPNWIDLDSDNDGILDIIEAGGTDSNNDGIADNTTDADGDGFADVYDPDASDGPGGSGTDGTALMTASSDGGDSDSRPEYANAGGTGDSDGDDVPDFLDVDADNDGIFDIYEAQATTGYTPLSGSDDDGDGIDNAFDDDDANWGGAGAAGLTPVNTDSGLGDTSPDYLDTDADGDGVPDLQEAWDSIDDGDSRPDGVTYADCFVDSDGDGLVDAFDTDDANISTWTINITPPTDDGTGGSTTSVGVNISLSNELDDIFPNNAGGNSISEPDWRDTGNGECATATTIYAMTDGGTAVEWNSNTQKHVSGANTGIVRATALCQPSGGWYRFYNPLEPQFYLFAIQNGTNTTDLTEVIDYIEIEIEAAPVISLGGDKGFAVMARSWKVVTKGALDGSVNIRFYFTPTEYSEFNTAANGMYNNYSGASLEYEWFKVNSGVNYGNIPSDRLSLSGDNYVDLDNDISGDSKGQADSDPDGNNKNYIQFNGLTTFSGGTFGATISGTLPVEWLSFTVQMEEGIGVVDWATASETNADYYSIERSIDGNLFSPIGQQKAVGTSQQLNTYQFHDTRLSQIPEAKAYYRLRQVDLDGHFEYSNVVELDLSRQPNLLWLQAMPIPAITTLNVRYGAMEGNNNRLQIYSLTGQQLYDQVLPQGVGEQSISVGNWPNAVYYLRLQGEKKQIIRKFQVKH